MIRLPCPYVIIRWPRSQGQENAAGTSNAFPMIIREAIPSDAPKIARIHVDTWRAAYRGQISDEYLDGLDYDRAERTGPAAIARGEGRSQEVFLLVAVDDDESVVGFAVGGPEQSGIRGFSGELHALYVSASCQRSGVGRVLVQSTAERLAEQGHKSMLVWTLCTNPARGFYERLAGTFVRTGPIEIGGNVYEKVAYGWSDITVLLPSRSSSDS